jgi:hypothetical protein
MQQRGEDYDLAEGKMVDGILIHVSREGVKDEDALREDDETGFLRRPRNLTSNPPGRNYL